MSADTGKGSVTQIPIASRLELLYMLYTDRILCSMDAHCMDLWMDGLTSQLGSPPQCGGIDQALVETQPQSLSQDLCNDNRITGTHVKVYT